ncbi:MAG TPA: lytic transglycosylase domain-containing protein [Candidatus Limnocylindria bacterium]|nr:lytic transglycosylase domain-containing protein [Candidatus Limnocylindria bacterium]
MRVTPLLAVVAALVVSGCATMRPEPASPSLAALPPVPEPPAVVEPEPEQKPEPQLQIACVEEPLVDTWERRYRAQRSHWEDHLDHPRRGGKYFPEVQRMVDEAGLPPEVAFLPTLESGYRSEVRGIGGLGLWQLCASTARRYGLVVTPKRDDRLNPHLATKAAIRYLQDLYERYGDWPLALAAYNAGEGRVDRALRLYPGASYWDLAERGQLPTVTCTYVPRLLGLVRAARPDECAEPSDDSF